MSHLECTQIDDLLMDYLYQELAPEQHAEFRAHLDSCERCAREVRELQGVRAAVHELPVLEPPKALSAQLLHQAAAASRPAFPWLRQLWELLQPRRSFYAVAAAASLVVVLFVGYALRKGQLAPSFPAAERTLAEAPAATPTVPARPAAPAPTAGSAAPLGSLGGTVAPMESEAKLERAAVTATAKEAERPAAKSATAYPVRLDSESVQREKTAGKDLGWDSSNVGRLSDAKKGGFGLLSRSAPAPDQGGARTRAGFGDDQRPDLARQAKQAGPAQQRPPQAVLRGAQAAPVLNAPAGGPAAGAPPPPRRPAEPQADLPTQRAAPRPAPRAQQEPAAPAQAADELEDGSYRRRGGGGAPPAAAQPAFKPTAPQSALDNRNEEARDKDEGRGFAQAPSDQRARMRASVDYKVAMGVPCEKQIKLLEDFIGRYPWDSHVKEAKIRIAVCRARLTGRSDEVDDVLRSIEVDRRKKSLREAEQRAAPDRAGPARRRPAAPMAERQAAQKTRKAAPATAERQRAPARAANAQAAKRAPSKPTAKAKAGGKAAPPTATAAKGKKAAPSKAAPKAKARSKPAAADALSK